jgi:hypothetical protein
MINSGTAIQYKIRETARWTFGYRRSDDDRGTKNETTSTYQKGEQCDHAQKGMLYRYE